MIPFLEAVYTNSPLPRNEQVYHEIMDQIAFSNIPAQIYSKLNEQNRLTDTPLFFQHYLKSRYQQILFQNMAIKKQTKDVIALFEQAQLAVIPLKGTYLAERYFSDVGARCTTDIDILIKKKDYHKSVALLEESGYTISEQRPDHFHANFVKEQGGKSFSIELHWNILHETKAEIQMDDFWQEAIPLETYTYVKQLSPYHTFYHLCLHGCEHQLASARYFLDIIQMIHQVPVDYKKVFDDASRYKTRKRLKNTLRIVYSQFPHLQQLAPLPMPPATLWWKPTILNPKIKQNPIQKYGNWLYGEWYHHCLVGDTIGDQMKLLKQWMMPSREQLTYEGFDGYSHFYQECTEKTYKTIKKIVKSMAVLFTTPKR